MRRKIIFATNNEGKVKEIRQIFSGERKRDNDSLFEIVSLKDIGVDITVEENGSSFEENAMIKAKAIMKITGEMVLADDSGFEVDYLNKEPGIYSARYLGEDTPYSVKNNEILKRCKEAKDGERTARFVCAIACAFPDGQEIITRGVFEGELAKEPAGEYGFGYDPIFYLPERGCTSGELLPEVKNEISHRGIALRKMIEELNEVFNSE